MTDKSTQSQNIDSEQSESKSNYSGTPQDMAYDVYRIYQSYWKAQQEALLQYWTQAVKNAYNPWK